MNEEYVGGKIFSSIESDARVNKDLKHCLYCEVSTSNIGNTRALGETNKKLEFQIELVGASSIMKQCPACKRIYILADPTEEQDEDI